MPTLVVSDWLPNGSRQLAAAAQQAGWNVVCLEGKDVLLALAGDDTVYYGGTDLAQRMQEELAGTQEVNAYLIDEVGQMELFCPAFVEAVPRLLDGAVPAVLTVAQKGQGLIAQVKARADVRLVTVTDQNRDGLPEEPERWVRDHLLSR